MKFEKKKNASETIMSWMYMYNIYLHCSNL